MSRTYYFVVEYDEDTKSFKVDQPSPERLAAERDFTIWNKVTKMYEPLTETIAEDPKHTYNRAINTLIENTNGLNLE